MIAFEPWTMLAALGPPLARASRVFVDRFAPTESKGIAREQTTAVAPWVESARQLQRPFAVVSVLGVFAVLALRDGQAPASVVDLASAVVWWVFSERAIVRANG